MPPTTASVRSQIRVPLGPSRMPPAYVPSAVSRPPFRGLEDSLLRQHSAIPAPFTSDPGPWTGPALPSGNIQPVVCSQSTSSPPACVAPSPANYNVLLRASRRGEILSSGGFVSPTTGPDDGNGARSWGPGFDSG